MMVIISPAFSQTGVIKALLGGAGIGLTCVSRAAALGELLPSAFLQPPAGRWSLVAGVCILILKNRTYMRFVVQRDI